MDLKKIFLKEACPTPIGGQAVIEGIMMRGLTMTSIVIRLPNGKLHIKREKNKKPSSLAKLPIVRGVVSFFNSMVTGMKTITYSADVLERESEGEEEEPGRLEAWLEDHFGEKTLWNVILYLSVIVSLAVSIGIFVLLPTALTGLLKGHIHSHTLLNLMEGLVRLVLFIFYIILVRCTKDVRRTFMYHGAEHKTIHCFENGLDLTPDNAEKFYTLHPRCGTSFLMFVFVVSLVLFSLMGWPSLALRIGSRLILLPVVAGLSYELLRWAGRSDGWLVKVLSLPGLYLQKLTTIEPEKDQLEVAIAALKAVLDEDVGDDFEGSYDDFINMMEGQKIEP